MADESNSVGAEAARIDQAIIQSRLNALAVMMVTDRAERLGRIAKVVSRLKPGAYLIGTGPSTVGIVPLTVDEVVLGRAATPVEEPCDVVVDFQVADTIYLGPHEVSRAHAKVVRRWRESVPVYVLIDMGSTCGTFVNGRRVEDDGGQALTHRDMISLGPSQISTYLFFSREK